MVYSESVQIFAAFKRSFKASQSRRNCTSVRELLQIATIPSRARRINTLHDASAGFWRVSNDNQRHGTKFHKRHHGMDETSTTHIPPGASSGEIAY